MSLSEKVRERAFSTRRRDVRRKKREEMMKRVDIESGRDESRVWRVEMSRKGGIFGLWE